VDMKLAENIRALRKERGLTQEQLAEVLGVTVGAVHKWETRLSVPELPLILSMADLFDTSVDALLGYELKDNRLDATVERLWRYHRDKDREGLAEMERALKKYPNTFAVVHAGAALCHGIGLEAGDGPLLRRALELFGKARQLLPQNRDAAINDQTLCSSIAGIYFALGEREKGLQLLKEQNAGDLYSALIGEVLAAEMDRPEEALPYLSKALIHAFSNIAYIIFGFDSVYRSRLDLENGQAILRWGIETLRGLKSSDRAGFIDKLCAVYYVCLADFQVRAGHADIARDSLAHARSLALAFDAAPDYDLLSLRFVIDSRQPSGAYDTLGATGCEAIDNALKALSNDTLTAIWKELNAHEA